MTEWRPAALNELGTVVTGGTPPKAHPEWFGEETPFITPTDISGNARRADVERWLSIAGRHKFKSRLLPPNSVCFVSIGATIGKLCLTDSTSVTNQQINSIVPNRDTDGRFLYYLLRNEATRISQFAGGAATPIINKSAFSNVTVRVPDTAAQRAIGEVLGTLDDLIENNRRRIELLESMARAIYWEWFVHFRFPGHEDVPVVDSDLGPIPEGWDTRRVGDFADIYRTSLQPSKFPDETFDHFSIPAFDEAKLPSLDLGSAIRSNKYVIDSAAVLVSKLNPRIERTWLVTPGHKRRSISSTEFLILRPFDGISLEWLYLMVRSDGFQERLRALSGGTSTSHQRTRPNDFLNIREALPTQTLVTRFTDVVRPMLGEARSLIESNRGLSAMRDLLLPKLVSGEIDVSGLDLAS